MEGRQGGADAAAPEPPLGVVKWFHKRKGYGFIQPDVEDCAALVRAIAAQPAAAAAAAAAPSAAAPAPKPPSPPADVFMHKSALLPGAKTTDGSRVEFELGADRRGRQVAVAVRPSDAPLALRHREWLAADFDQLKSLHEEWFPVRYPDQYWRQACVNHRSLEGWPLLTLAATPAANAARLVGAMSAVIMDVGACEQLDPARVRGADGEPAQTAVYLKTLGVREEARRHGTALRLVRACELYGRLVGGAECGALWLHVIAYNTGAIRLYEKAGFVAEQHLVNFYTINGQQFDAYLYVKPLWPESRPDAAAPDRGTSTDNHSRAQDWI